MFWSTAHTLRVWWEDFSEDILGADLEPTVYVEDELDHHRSHPHRRPLGVTRPRRDGTVPARPDHCLSPVHHAAPRAPELRTWLAARTADISA